MKKYNSINCIAPRAHVRYTRGWRDGYNPPLGLVALKTFLAKHLPQIEVNIFDMEFDHTLTVEQVINADVVAVSPTAFSYVEALEILRMAKEQGKMTIMGGIYASHMTATILENQKFVDFVCKSDGEQVIYDLLTHKDPADIYNLVYRKNGQIIQNKVKHIPYENALPLDRSLIDMQPYFDRFSTYLQGIMEDLPYQRPIAIFSQRGCRWRVKTGGCLFCSRTDNVFFLKSPEEMWKEIELLINSYGVDLIWDFSDSFLSDLEWFDRFVAVKPAHVNPLFYVYGRADEITPEIARKLKQINVYQLLMGIETADPELKQHKGTSVTQDMTAARLLHDNGIKLFPSFCLGMPGESARSLEMTLNLAREVCSVFKPSEIASSILIPFAGSLAYKKMLKEFPETRRRFAGDDIILPEEVQKEWVKNYCSQDVQFSSLVQTVQEILKLAPLKSTFAAPVIEERLPFMDEASRMQLIYDYRYKTKT